MNQPASSPIDLGAAQLAELLADGQLSSREAVQAFVDRTEATHEAINAVAVPRFDEALSEAEEADRRRARGELLGPLDGVPVTVKECFHVAGTPACIGLPSLADERATADGPLVRVLRRGGAIILAKTNVPQLMSSMLCQNPVYGRTNNPWNPSRTPGGSTGGEAALIAARGSPLGLGTDLGGSIRIPAHCCGICGFRPTDRYLTRQGVRENWRGMETLVFQPGPMARQVDDLALMMNVLAGESGGDDQWDAAPVRWEMPSPFSVAGLRIAFWEDDGYFTPSPAVRRATKLAVDVLAEQGATVEPIVPPDIDEVMFLYLSVLGADGGADAARLIARDPVDSAIRDLVRIARLPSVIRVAVRAGLRLLGREHDAMLLAATRPRTADQYWRITHALRRYASRFFSAMDQGKFDVWISPVYGIAAPPHAAAPRLIVPAGYSFLSNALGSPCGCVPVTRVRSDEAVPRPIRRDGLTHWVRQSEMDSCGLPVGVQVAGRPWSDGLVMAVMKTLEEALRNNDDYPSCPDV